MNRDPDFSEDVLAIEDIVRTEQANRPASPPKPQIPIPEPTDEIIEEEITEIDDLNIAESSDPLSEAKLGNQGDSDEPVSNPQTSPSVIRIVEPTVPDAAKKAEIKAEIWVNFLVDEQGRVEEASISQIKLYDRESGEARQVDSIDYGLTEATLDAALQWKFRPAKNDGKVVKAYTRHIFTFGF
jgi:outer membrane biosynthesis protein TonB